MKLSSVKFRNQNIFLVEFDFLNLKLTICLNKITIAATIEIPWKDSGLVRNPKNKNKGKFVTLASFLELAKANKTGGVLINIQVSFHVLLHIELQIEKDDKLITIIGNSFV